MTPEQFSILIGAVGGSTAFLAIVQVITKLIDVYALRRTAGDTSAERKDGISQSDKDRLWKRVEQLEADAITAASRHDQQLRDLRDRHDRELIDVRTRLDTVVRQLGEAQRAVELTEAERQHAVQMYRALLQAHENLQLAHDELKLQVIALQAENTEMRRRLPSGQGE